MVVSVVAKLFALSISWWLFCGYPWTNVQGEYFSSVEQMRQLLKLEQTLLESLDRYIKLHEQKIEFLHRQRDLFGKELKEGLKHDVEYTSNPMSAFLLVNRLVTDWERIRRFMEMDVGVKLQNNTEMPTVDDLVGIAEGLARLQDMYQLDTKAMASGKLFDRKVGRQLKTAECYEIGNKLTSATNYRYAVSWLRESLRLWTTESPGVSKVEVMNALAYALSNQGEYEEALELTNKVLKLQPDNQRALNSKEPLEKWIEYKKEHGLPPPVPDANYKNYPSLCRGDYQRSTKEVAKLRCRYEHNRTPFLRIAPLKLEELNHDPFIVVYHEVLYAKEIATLLDIAKPLLHRSMVGDDVQKKVSKTRTSNNGWLDDVMHPVVRTISRRTEDMTDLAMSAAEQLQVGNYGVGGHYLPHHDYAVPEEGKEAYPAVGKGNRIATLSDVAIGGATVFPELGVGVFPRKGSAIFWYNLHANGSIDARTLHGACPVFVGSKWGKSRYVVVACHNEAAHSQYFIFTVANKWIHEYGQEFRRPCQIDQKV
ncbi:prolyl 4-hydroxylase subunit alpha-1-like isoform X2 [Anopheles funestus]|uniref:prolyl 4-hydroxylase subunit alpha-1-like isoform X2 n=1 Tax=Anopheles funestus TaxID=62324 RepID=UPI0020C6FC46|nr:prolyl 4-hydroxylase subunit alpha-1-like isoform X2 [Anopheles funestus]